MDIIKVIKSFFLDNQIEIKSKKILVACSGGPDSMALTHILYELSKIYEYEIGVCHLEHGIRGNISVKEARFVEDYCRDNGIAFYTKSVNVPELARKYKKSQELVAREVRYEFMADITKEHNYDFLATGHHLNDQSETILMRLIRGTGPTGLIGMTSISRRKIRGINLNIIRPFLSIDKNQILEYCRKNKIKYCTDQSNFSVEYTRNKIRWEIIPKLMEMNPKVLNNFNILSKLLLQQDRLINLIIQAKIKEILVKKSNEEYLCSINLLKSEDICIRQGIYKFIYEKLNGSKLDLLANNIARLEDILYNGNVGKKIQLPNGIWVEKNYDELFFKKGIADRNNNIIKPSSIVINLEALTDENSVEYCYGNKKICFTKINCSNKEDHRFTSDSIFLPINSIKGRLVIRTRQSGDIIELANLGRKKLKNILIDEKIPRQTRDLIPVIADDEGIIWIVGIRYCNRCQINQGQLLYIKTN